MFTAFDADDDVFSETHERMLQPKYVLDPARRAIVRDATVKIAERRGWFLTAAHILPTHAHIVITAPVRPKRVVNDIHSCAGRKLNLRKLDAPGRKRWTRGASGRYLWTPDDVGWAEHYVLHEQGEPMATYPQLGGE